MSEHICYWYDGDSYHLTRCVIGANGKPEGLPPGADVRLVIEHYIDYEPTFYDETVVNELGVENQFP